MEFGQVSVGQGPSLPLWLGVLTSSGVGDLTYAVSALSDLRVVESSPVFYLFILLKPAQSLRDISSRLKGAAAACALLVWRCVHYSTAFGVSLCPAEYTHFSFVFVVL